jgi:alkylhydroperoxidase/carboxymuconolactone decarboxylase family protein YurZ
VSDNIDLSEQMFSRRLPLWRVMAGKPGFLEQLEERDPEFGELVSQARAQSRAGGALSAKTKVLIAMALDAGMNRPDGVESLSAAAREQGATDEEILETIELVTSMCGLQGLVTGMHAFEDDE